MHFDEGINIDPGLFPCEPILLQKEEIQKIAEHPEVGHSSESLMSRLKDGCQCFGLDYQSEIAAYMWCNFRECKSWSTFKLNSNELYLFDARVFKKFRGLNLAPYLRVHLYRYFINKGYDTFYSVTDYFNTPAKKFKKKIGAKNFRLMMCIKLFNIYEFHFQIREYGK